MIERFTTPDNERISYLGNLFTTRKRVFISTPYKASKAIIEKCYVSAFEASLSGYNVLFIPFSPSSDAIEKGIVDGKGAISYIFPCGFNSVRRKYLHNLVITSGVGISVENDDENVSYKSVMRAKSVAAYFSDVVICADENIKINKDAEHIKAALDMGRDVAVLKSALSSSILQDYAKSGAPVIDSFSDLLISPKYYLYRRDDGVYSYDKRKFDILSFDE